MSSADDPLTVSSASVPCSSPNSPKDRLKFYCCHGGRILPRPADGHLKYVGGETRVISVPRDINFQELMKKLTYLIDGEMILKYQVVSEDLDALVSVKSNEDLRHMFDEIDRYKSAGSPRMRAFLFPINPVVIENQISSVEQRYIDTINGIVRSPPYSIKQHPTFNPMHPSSMASSACSSPRSTESFNFSDVINNTEFISSNHQNSGVNIPKVQSSPSMVAMHQIASPSYRHGNYSGNHSPKRCMDSLRPEKLTSIMSPGRGMGDGIRYQGSPTPQNYCYSPSRQSKDYCFSPSRQNRAGYCMQHDDCGRCSDRVIDRHGGIVVNSVPSSPRYAQGGMKVWDGTMRAD